MADNVERETFSSFMNITETSEHSDQMSAEDFLSETTEITPIKEVVKTETAQVKKEAPKKEEEVKKEPEFDAEKEFLGELEEDKEEVEDKEEEKEDDKEVNQFEVLSKELYNIGVFSPDGEEAEIASTPEDFKTLFEKQGQKKATVWLDNFLSNFGEDYRAMFDAVFINGVDPTEYLSAYTELENVATLDITDETNQELVVREYYTRAGWKKTSIDAKIQKLKDYADLEEEAKNVHEQMITQDQKRLQELEESNKRKLAAKQSSDQEYKSNITKIIQEKVKEKEFDGLPVSEKTAQAAFDFLYTKKYKTPDGQELTEFDKFIFETRKPENLNKRIKIALLALSDFDFSKIEKRAITKESNTIFKDLTTHKPKKTAEKMGNTWLKI